MKDEALQIQLASSFPTVEQPWIERRCLQWWEFLWQAMRKGPIYVFSRAAQGRITPSISAAITFNRQHSGIQMESCQSPLGQSWPWEPLERRMRLICVFHAFHNECLTQETRWGVGEGHKQGGRVCEILLSLWLCAWSCRFIIESLAVAAAGAKRPRTRWRILQPRRFLPPMTLHGNRPESCNREKKSYYASQWGTDDTVWNCQGAITRNESVADRKTLQVCVNDSAPSSLLSPSLHLQYGHENSQSYHMPLRNGCIIFLIFM